MTAPTRDQTASTENRRRPRSHSVSPCFRPTQMTVLGTPRGAEQSYAHRTLVASGTCARSPAAVGAGIPPARSSDSLSNTTLRFVRPLLAFCSALCSFRRVAAVFCAYASGGGRLFGPRRRSRLLTAFEWARAALRRRRAASPPLADACLRPRPHAMPRFPVTARAAPLRPVTCAAAACWSYHMTRKQRATRTRNEKNCMLRGALASSEELTAMRRRCRG